MKRLTSLLAVALLAACGGGATPALPAIAGLGALTIYAPSADGAANVPRPVIRWTPAPGAPVYRVSVWADAARTQRIAEAAVRSPELPLTRALADGAEVYVDVVAEGTGLATSSRFKVVLLPDSFPGFRLARVDALRMQGGYKLFNVLDIRTPPGEDKVPAMVLVNAFGEVVWWYVHNVKGILTDPRVLENGNITFIVRDNVDPAATTSFGYEMTWDGTVVWRSRDGALVHHELAPGPEGKRLYMTYLAEVVDGISYEGDGLELVDPATDQVVWTWSVFDHFRPEDFPVPEADFDGLSHLGRDWSHANSAVWDEARGVIWMSIRHFDRLIGIDYPSGDVRITVGEGGLGPPGYMSHQHAPEVQPDGAILFWDNGNGHVPQVSRAKMFQLDELAGTVTPVFEWEGSPPFYDHAVGDADRQPNGNFLITAGVSGRVIEVDPAGETVWELQLVTQRHWIYRTQQVPMERIPPEILPFR